jgi:hypothetical protein
MRRCVVNRRLAFFLTLTVLLSLTLSCGLFGGGGGDEAPTPAEEPAGGEEVAATEVVSGGGEDTEEIEPEPETETEEVEDISLSSVTSGLQSLDSYRGHFEMAFERSGGEEEGKWVMQMDIEHVRDPFAQRMTIQGGEVGLGEGFESVQIGDQQYIVFGEGECISTSANEEDAMDMEMFQLDDAIGGLDSARRVRPDETVNGILSRHYVFDEKSIGWGTFSRAEGEVWVAVDGDYVVKYILQAEGKNPITNDEGHVEWGYEIRDVNQPITIEPPAGCEATESEFPLMPDAANRSTMGGLVTYESNSSFDDVLSFYQEQMPADGWNDSGDSFISPGSAMLGYTKDGRTVTIAITDSEDKISVMIMSE